VYGLIKVENKHRGDKWVRFTDEDIHSLSIFVRAISHAIESNDSLMSVLGRLYVFVLMPFHRKFTDLFECGIEPAVREVGMQCERVDLADFTEDIMRRVYQNITRADIVISVSTDKNPNVFYETGYSHALGKPTICLAEDANDIPFDLRHYPHIIYSPAGLSDLKRALQKRLIGIRAKSA
jgi:nucleoside 2-deoxyribosyltransferase